MGKGSKKKKRVERKIKTKLIFIPGDEGALENGSGEEEFDDEESMILEKEDVRLIYNALKEYKPTEEEENLHMVLLESFEETLVVHYGEPYPDAN